MRIRILKQVMAIALSLSVGTPGWAGTSVTTGTSPATSASSLTISGAPAVPVPTAAPANTPAAPAGGLPAPIKIVADTPAYAEALQDLVTNCSGEKVKSQNFCDGEIAGVTQQQARAAAIREAFGNKDKGEMTQQLKTADVEANTLIVAAQKAQFKCSAEIMKCVNACGPEKVQAIPAPTTNLPGDVAAAAEARKFLVESRPFCPRAADNQAYVAKFGGSIAQAQAGKAGILSAMMSVKGLAITGAVVGGAYLLTRDKKDKKDEESDTDKANGVITNSDGTKTTCFSADSYTKTECKSTLLSLCQSTKADTSGCRAFESAYCANEGNGSNYCLYAEAKVYCSQAGSMISSSPACTWKSSRASACLSDPEAVSCLATGTVEALTLSCANYPNDPLCKANAAGRVVVQGGTSTTSSTVSTTAATSTNSVSMSSVIGNASTTNSASNLQVIAGDNLWSASSSAVQKACASGHLLNCL